MSVKGSFPGPQAVTLIGLVVGAVGIAILWASGIEFPVSAGHHHPAGRRGFRRARPRGLGTGCGGAPRPFRHDRLPDQSHGLEQPDRRGRSERGDRPDDPGDRCAYRGDRRSRRHAGQLSEAGSSPDQRRKGRTTMIVADYAIATKDLTKGLREACQGRGSLEPPGEKGRTGSSGRAGRARPLPFGYSSAGPLHFRLRGAAGPSAERSREPAPCVRDCGGAPFYPYRSGLENLRGDGALRGPVRGGH